MAKIDENLYLIGARGMVGKQMVFRNQDGKIILAKRPRRKKQQTDAQLEQTIRFKEATIYAKAVLADDDLRKGYAEKALNRGKGFSAYNMAVADYLKGPVVRKIDLEKYNGQVGEVIVVSAVDNFEVKEVMVEIRQSDNSLVEKGEALADLNGIDWKYTTQSVNGSPSGSVVTVRVSDRPGNVTVKEEVI